MSSEQTGILILNLGTPDSPEPPDVARYLKQFLMDSRVVDIFWPLRWILVHVLVVPKRKFSSSEAYKKIWGTRGSPLKFHSYDLTKKISERFPDHKVALGMRYGNPTVRSALEDLKAAGCKKIIAMGQYPQYADSSTGTAKDECVKEARRIGYQAQQVWWVRSFYEHPEFIRAYALKIQKTIEQSGTPDHILFSYHGLPERHMKKLDQTGQHCLVATNCCNEITEANRNCYRAQAFATTRALAKYLGLKPEQYSISFQSRLGRTPWIKPYTDLVVPELAHNGVKHLCIVTPSFTVDCLETVEEIGIRAKQDFLAAGGVKFTRVECLNAEEAWVEGMSKIVRETISGL